MLLRANASRNRAWHILGPRGARTRSLGGARGGCARSRQSAPRATVAVPRRRCARTRGSRRGRARRCGASESSPRRDLRENVRSSACITNSRNLCGARGFFRLRFPADRWRNGDRGEAVATSIGAAPSGPRASPWSGSWADAPRGQSPGLDPSYSLQPTVYGLRGRLAQPPTVVPTRRG